MRTTRRLMTVASAVSLSAMLAACGTPDPYGPNNYPVSSATPGAPAPSPNGAYPNSAYPSGTYPAQPVAAVEYGHITNISMISPGTGPAPSPGRTAAGSVIGAIVGGLLGNQIGQGTGRTAATVLGAGAGAVVGSNVAGRPNMAYNNAYPVYRVTMQTDQGIVRTYDVNATGNLHPGDRVRVENGVIYLA